MPSMVGWESHSGSKEGGMNTKLAMAVIVAGTLLVAVFLSGCGGGGGVPIPVDLSPVGGGLTFLGLALVLSAIIGLFSGGRK